MEAYQKGRPVLIGTRSIEMNEFVSRLFEQFNIPHQVLNAKHHEEEGAIIAQAGRLKAVTVATNMAGRGVDIILGGNPPDEEEAKKVKELGGLLVLGTERHEARRIDDQLRGRAGRQGDPGSSQFYLSLEDDLLRVFGSERLKKMMEKLNMPEDLPIESKLVAKAVREAQKKIEGINFDIRKRTLEYDEVLQKQREKLMPVAKQYSIEQIMELLDAYIRKNRRKVFLPYLMLKEVNDTPQHLRALEQLIFKRKDIAYLYHVNLIRYHSSPLMEREFQCSSKKTIDWFKGELEKTRIGVTIRESFGEDACAACGQLHAEYKKFVSSSSS